MEIQKANKNGLFDNICNLLSEARRSIVRNVNRTMVYTYFEIGRMIVEDEQHGKNRAEYGKQTLVELLKHLTKEFGEGFSFTNLHQMRQFYLAYSNDPILQTASDELQNTDKHPIALQYFQLSWSHYLKLRRIEDRAERRFYEIETVANNWSLKELKRQCDSALYQCLALSRDKQGIKELSAEKGQIIEKPEDALKDPLILEFIGLPDNIRYSESELEQKLIDRLEDENKTVGIILCQDKSETLVRITLPEDNRQIFASRYQTVLPSKEELKKIIEN
jgi:predicted nuclease of restriction endonuclease-like (RecB) superfamily